MPMWMLPVNDVSVMLHYTNFAANLFVYTLSCTTFRQELQLILSSWLHGKLCVSRDYNATIYLPSNINNMPEDSPLRIRLLKRQATNVETKTLTKVKWRISCDQLANGDIV
jgi:hypothetical protein